MGKTLFFDTCALLNVQEKAFGQHFVIAQKTLKELENIKTSRNKDVDIKRKANTLTHLLDKNYGKYTVEIGWFSENIEDNLIPDNEIMLAAKSYMEDTKEDIIFVSDDIACKNLARNVFGFECVGSAELFGNSIDRYKGYKEVTLSDEQLSEFYSNISVNTYDCLTNEYFIIKNSVGETIDTQKWNGTGYVAVTPKTFKSSEMGNIKPLDEIQTCAMDSLVNNEISVFYGRSGSGKTTLPLAYAMAEIEKHRYDKLIIIYSYETLKGAKTLGFEKGDHTTKLLNSASIGNILASKFGDITGVEYLMAKGKLEILPTANIRGVEFKNSVVLVTEAQNLDVYTLKTIIQRCKDGCKQIYEGDIIEQKDTNISMLGMDRLIEVFKGHPSLGCVKLKNNYRSQLSELADKM